MNPKITISIDAKNKAIVTLTGIVTVGSKVDIEISGLPDSIPNWREIDPYTGKSLRFRVVDCLGNDLVRYPLLKKGNETNGDTWDVGEDGVYANSVGCEVEFNTHKLRHAFNQVPFNEYMELGIILDSFVDSAEYAIGKIKVRQWSSASCDTPTVLPDWREILHGLKTDLESVNQSKASAAASATQSATSATNSATSALSASASESSAADYAAVANEAKEDAVEAMLKYPYIDEFGHWRVWSIVAGEWVDHGDAGAHYDDEVTETSEHGVKSSGIWNWVKSLLPDWLNKNYAEPATTASVSAEEQRAKAIELDLRRRVENLGSSKADKTTTYTKSETDAAIVANVENSVTSTSTTKALSANMGKELQDQIQNLKQRGRYLSIWDCTTGLAKTEPTVNPYEYKAGDYFIVGTVGTANYRPSGTSYDKDVPSTTVETGSPIVNDTYYYDGTSWTLLHTEQSEISWGSVVSKPDTFPPEAHTHTKSQITDFPTEMPPTAHSHASDSWFTTALRGKRDYDDRSWGDLVSGVKANGDYSIIMEERDGANYYRKIPDSIGSDSFAEFRLFLTEATGDEQGELWVYQVRHFINGGSEMDLDVSSVSDGGFVENTITVTGEAGNMTFVKGYYRIDSFALTSDIPNPVRVIDPASATEAGKAADALATKNALNGKANVSDFAPIGPADYVTNFVQRSATLQAQIKSVAQSLIRTAVANFDPDEQSFADLVNILKNIGA